MTCSNTAACLSLPQDFNNSPLHYAVRYCHFDPKGDAMPLFSLVHLLIKAGADINQVNELGVTPLGFAAMFNQPAPRQKLYVKMIKWLIKHGADVNVVDKGGHTPLEIASSWGNMDLVIALVQQKAHVRRDVEYLSLHGPSAVDVAANDNVRSLLKTKLKQELNEFQRVKDLRKAEELRLLIKQQKEKDAAKRQNEREKKKMLRDEARMLKRNADIMKHKDKKTNADKYKEQEALEESRKADQALADDQNAGFWRKEAPLMWTMQKSVSQTAADGVSTMDEAKALIEDMQGAAQRGMLQRRWRAMTGQEITKDHMVMGGTGGIAQKKVR